MAERMTALSIATLFEGNHNHDRIPAFLTGFAEVLHPGGRKPQFLGALKIDTDFPVRLLVGLPMKLLSREQRLLAEVYTAWTLGRDLGDVKGLWTSGRGWQPTNPGRVPAPVEESLLDVPWMLSLGVPRPVWERHILLSESALRRAENGYPGGEASIRHLLALAVFGFADPYQFFTARVALNRSV